MESFGHRDLTGPLTVLCTFKASFSHSVWALENEDPDPSYPSYYFTANQVTVAELARLDLCSGKSVLGEAPAIIT